jgi:hypothetical protein
MVAVKLDQAALAEKVPNETDLWQHPEAIEGNAQMAANHPWVM